MYVHGLEVYACTSVTVHTRAGARVGDRVGWGVEVGEGGVGMPLTGDTCRWP